MSCSKTVVAFDLYGTLLSTESIAKTLGDIYGDDAAKGLASLWRRYQLEYTWRANSMGIYRPFSDVTRAALRHAVAESRWELSGDVEERLMRAYDGLDAFPEIPAALARLAREPGLDAYIFSNGTHDMVSASVATSETLSAGGRGPFSDPGRLVTVEPVGTFKPDPRVYRHLAQATGAAADMDRVWVVSANPFDALGARAAGVHSAWIDRAGSGWLDALGGLLGEGEGEGEGTSLRPTIIAAGVDEAVGEIVARTRRV